jgi:hypothetical protein
MLINYILGDVCSCFLAFTRQIVLDVVVGGLWVFFATCRKSLTNFTTMLYRLYLAMKWDRTHNISGDRH